MVRRKLQAGDERAPQGSVRSRRNISGVAGSIRKPGVPELADTAPARSRGRRRAVSPQLPEKIRSKVHFHQSRIPQVRSGSAALPAAQSDVQHAGLVTRSEMKHAAKDMIDYLVALCKGRVLDDDGTPLSEAEMRRIMHGG